MEFVDLVLALFEVQPLVLSFLYGFAKGVDELSGFQGRAENACLDGIDLLHELGPHFCVGLFQRKCLLELAVRGSDGVAAMTVGGADNGVVELGIDVGDVELRVDEVVP